MGVRRAVEIASREAAREATVYTMGPLIHNPSVLAALQSAGCGILDEERFPETLEGIRLIIRAHGISPALEKTLLDRGALLVDATCPRVKANQLLAADLFAKGYRLFLAGERQHAEIIGIQGYAPGCMVLGNRAEAEAAAAALAQATDCLTSKEPLKVALIGQTTISPEEFIAIGMGIRAYLPQAEIINTICSATEDRQEALRVLCAQVDALLVVGGIKSANTQRLQGIAKALGKPVWLIETAADIPSEILAYPVVGLSAGASTPDALIDEIEAALNALPPY